MNPTQLPGYRSAAVRDGCEVCGAQDTAWLSAFTGRRCDTHRPVFDLATAVRVALNDPGAAIAYLRTFAALEAA